MEKMDRLVVTAFESLVGGRAVSYKKYCENDDIELKRKKALQRVSVISSCVLI